MTSLTVKDVSEFSTQQFPVQMKESWHIFKLKTVPLL